MKNENRNLKIIGIIIGCIFVVPIVLSVLGLAIGSFFEVLDNQRIENQKTVSIVPLEKGSMIMGQSRVSILIGTKNTFVLDIHNLSKKGGLWTIADPSIAKVDQRGVVEGIKEGSTLLNYQAKNKKYHDSIVLNVFRKVQSLKPKDDIVTLRVGESYQPSFTVVPSDAKVVYIPTQLGAQGQMYFDTDGTIEMKKDGSIVALKAGLAAVGFRYGFDQNKDGYAYLPNSVSGFIGSTKVRVLADQKGLEKYLKDVKLYRNRLKKAIKAKITYVDRSDLEEMYNTNLVKMQTDDEMYINLKNQVTKTSDAVEEYYNTDGKKENAKAKRDLQKNIVKLTTILTELDNK
jgi:hypothetical protein